MKYRKIILLFLITIWISLAFFNVFYNSVKSISEVKEWGPLSNEQKLQKIFGPVYEFSVFLDANTKKDSDILFYSNDSMSYFYARYFLYPRHLYWYQNPSEYVRSTFPKKTEYVAAYNMNVSLNEYEKVTSFSAKFSEDFGFLYKRK